jgi:hypothetical protein
LIEDVSDVSTFAFSHFTTLVHVVIVVVVVALRQQL